MIRSEWFPRGTATPEWASLVLDMFRRHEAEIGTTAREHALTSEEVLAVLADDLRSAGFTIERRQLQVPKLDSTPEGGAQLVQHQIDVFHPQWMCCLAIETLHGPASPLHSGDFVDPLLVVDMDSVCLAVP